MINYVTVTEKDSAEILYPELSLDQCHSCNATAFIAKPPDHELSVLWHSRLGHPGIGALSHLSRSVEGVPSFLVDEVLCETCRLAKATERISRTTSDREIPEVHPFHRTSCDILQLEPGYNGDEYVVHFQCYKTAFNLVFCEPQRAGIARVFLLFLMHIQTQYNKTVRI